MLFRLGALAFLFVALSSSIGARADIYRIADQADAGSKHSLAYPENAEKDMEIARFYFKKRDYAGTIIRCKILVTFFPTSEYVDEALTLLAESSLAADFSPESTAQLRKDAQTAVAVLNRKFPNSGWSHVAGEILKSAGLEAVEDENSWISRAFK